MGRNKETIMFLVCILFSASMAISSAWRPIVSSQPSTSILSQEAALAAYNIDDSSFGHHQILGQQDDDQCALYKVAMNQQLYFEVSY